MNRLNRDTLIAAILLCLVGFFFYSSYNIRTPGFERLAPSQMGPGLWPRVILIGLMIIGVVYLFQSIIDPPPPGEKRGGLAGWYRHYRNPIWCFPVFAVFLLLIPQLGMLISGVLFVFGLMTLLGAKDMAAIKRHGWTTLGTVGGMWFIFACLSEVQLPNGKLTGGLEEWMLVNICGLVVLLTDSLRQVFAGLDGGVCHAGTIPVV